MTKEIPVIFKILKIFGLVSLFLLAAAYFAGSTVIVQRQQGQILCKNIHIQIVDSTAAQLVLQQDIRAFLDKSGMHLIGKKINEINLYQLEQLISREKGIKNSEAFVHLNGVLTLRIVQRSPLFRLETSRGSFYLDDSGALFPTIPQRTAYVPVVSGNIPVENESWIAQLYDFGSYIRSHRFWNAQIEQLYVHKPHHIELIQRAGVHMTVIMGDFDRFEYKLQKLYTFYRTVAVSEGWDRYNYIDLRFNNQIVCRKIR